jgi:hypothetical protein
MTDQLTATQPRSRAVTRRVARRDQRVRRFKRQLLQVAPNLDDARFGPMIHAFARLSILSLDAYEHLRLKGIVNANGELRSSVDVVQRLVNAQLKLANALGLTPLALGKLKPGAPDDLAAMLADGK